MRLVLAQETHRLYMLKSNELHPDGKMFYQNDIMFKNTFIQFGAIILISCIIGCSNNQDGPLANKSLAMGRINTLVVLAEKELWEGEIGDTLDYYFASAYPVLPAPEPFFDLKYFSAEEMNAEPFRREFRNILVVADVSDTTASVTKLLRKDLGPEKFNRALTDPDFNTLVGLNKWARGQVIIYLFGNGKEALDRAIKDHFPSIAKRVNKNDEAALAASIYGSMQDNQKLAQVISDSFGIKLRVPSLYVKAIEEENFLWIRADQKDVNQSLVFRKFKYTDKSQLTKASLIKMRNEYGRKYITTASEGAYMVTNDVDLPVYEYIQPINDIYAVEIRGIWETENDFMGGPFISYALLNEKKGEIIFIDAFVFAPGKDKRDYMQQLDYVVKTVRLKE